MGDGWMLARPREGVNGEVRSDAPRVDIRDVPRLELHASPAPQRDALLAFGDEERPRPLADSFLGVREGVRRRHNPAAACVSGPHCPSAVSVERVRWNALTASVASMPGRA